ncbi:MAG: pyridoxamine 5'-phosphate oxidase family protein [Candidatus Dormiibacterota bacterium]
MAPLGVRALSRTDCLDLLGTATVGRLGVSVQALPAILPVNFVLTGDRVVFRTVPGTKLDAALARAVVAFEADEYDAAGAWGWSVLVRGVAGEIVAPDELAEARALPLRAWPCGDGAERFVAVPITFVSGRAFGVIPAG